MSSIKEKRKLSKLVNVSKSLFELKVKGTLCDVQLSLPGSTVLAHACVLASCSSFFLELFQLNQEIHWCVKNPLVINLENLIDDSKDLCEICVTKIVDFMYLRELVIVQDHYEHFVVINSLFQVFDSMPNNCKKAKFCKADKIESPSIKQHSKMVQMNKNCIGDSLSEEVTFSRSSNAGVSTNCSFTNEASCVTSETIKNRLSENGEIKSTTNTAVIREVSSDLEDKSYPSQVSTTIPEATVKSDCKKNKEINTKKTCEFLCCNPEQDINSSRAKVRKRRMMLCEGCSFSSVCIRKVMQHLCSTDHLQSSCPICLRKIYNINDLKDHLKDHANSKPFICQICNKRDRYWEYHKIHLKIHCRNKPFYCDLCQRGFVSRRSLTEHLATHKGSYICNKCDYFTSDLNMYRSHLVQHENKVPRSDSSSEFQFDTAKNPTKQKVRNFECQVCSEKFTQKKNLARHVRLKHFDTTKFRCSMCVFVSNRIDLLSQHMKKKHNCTLVKEKRKSSSEKKLIKESKQSSDLVRVLIPIQLVPNNSVVNNFDQEDNGRSNTVNKKSTSDSFSNTRVILHQNPNVDIRDPSKECKEQNESFSLSSNFLQDNNILNRESVSLGTDISKTDCSENSSSDTVNSNMQVNFMSTPHSFNKNVDSSKNNFLSSQTLSAADCCIRNDINTIDRQDGILEGNKCIWLNEATGELLSDETLMNMQVQKTAFKANQNVLETENSTVEISDQLKSSVLNEASGECSGVDPRDDNEEWQCPQTPQASVVGIDDCDNLFPWNHIDNSFYSTWVLNEITGELNMVSFFSIQSVKNPSELKLRENSESLAPLEDDDTALFLNEGTGDLSVIYFNPNGPERSDLKLHSTEKPSHDNLDILSEISDDDSDLLNEEFMRVSASFMSNEENEKFLNELTGEFDIANLNNYQPELLNNPVTGDESYLNEETGEISWNIMDGNENNDFFTKPDSLEYDLDDSLNCEDFESFFRDVSGFSSQFCLDETGKKWQSADEVSDTVVLNECTGELVKRG